MLAPTLLLRCFLGRCLCQRALCACCCRVLLQRVYQYHKEHIGVETKVTEDHVLGVYDAAATEAARKRDETAKISEAGTAWLEQQAELQPAASQGSKNKDEAAAGNTANDAGQEADSQQQQATGDGSASEAAAAESGSGSNKAADSPELPAGPHYPPSMLELLDYLPDTAPMIHSWWPYYRQMYTGRRLERWSYCIMQLHLFAFMLLAKQAF